MRPFIHLNFAFDQWGRHCGTDGKPLAISCTMDWQRVHALRELYDAVAVGGAEPGTWIVPDSTSAPTASEEHQIVSLPGWPFLALTATSRVR